MARLCNHKFLLNCCNLLFLLCGGALLVAGFYLFSDTKRILLSRLLAATSEQLNNLPQPLFYYCAIALALAGLIAVLAAIVGFWASCLDTYFCLSVYFLTVVLLLLAESVACLAITLWPHCLGISLDTTKMVRALQGNYGVPGKEQFTSSMDLAQTRFGCCGMSSDSNYDTSRWRLQGYGRRDWAVPLTCCILANAGERLAHLDPRPANETQCEQLTRGEHERYRYTEPCLLHLDNWYREQYVLFLAASLILALVEFCVLLCIVLNCTRISGKALALQHGGAGGDFGELRVRSKPLVEQNIYQTDDGSLLTNGGGGGTAAGNEFARTSAQFVVDGGAQETDDFKVYRQPRDLYKQRHNTTFKPSSNGDYNLPTSRSYLV